MVSVGTGLIVSVAVPVGIGVTDTVFVGVQAVLVVVKLWTAPVPRLKTSWRPQFAS